MIERDDNYPDFAELMSELNHAKSIDSHLYPEAWRKAA